MELSYRKCHPTFLLRTQLFKHVYGNTREIKGTVVNKDDSSAYRGIFAKEPSSYSHSVQALYGGGPI